MKFALNGALTIGTLDGANVEIKDHTFSDGGRNRYNAVSWASDFYQAFADFRSYVDMQAKVDEAYKNQDNWVRMALINIANMGYFSSDRSIEDYAKNIWNIEPIE